MVKRLSAAPKGSKAVHRRCIDGAGSTGGMFGMVGMVGTAGINGAGG